MATEGWLSSDKLFEGLRFPSYVTARGPVCLISQGRFVELVRPYRQPKMPQDHKLISIFSTTEGT